MKIFFSCILLFAVGAANAQEKKIINYPHGNKHYEFEQSNGLLNGSFACYYENGKLMTEGKLTNNQRTGTWKAWDKNGVLREERNYGNGEQFLIVREWDKNNKPVAAEIVDKKNAEVLRSSNITWKTGGHVFYAKRFWKLIKPDNGSNDLFFTDRKFLDQLIVAVKASKYGMFSDDRFVIPDSGLLAKLKNENVVGFLIKEDATYYTEQKAIRHQIIGICPVAGEDCHRELGWIYWPEISEIMAKDPSATSFVNALNNSSFTSTIVKTTFQSKNNDGRYVPADESLELELGLLQYEASVWIYQVDKEL